MAVPSVHIAGIGAVTGYGWGVGALWQGVSSGVSACRPVKADTETTESVIPSWAARIPDGGDPDDGPTLFARGMLASVREALADARSHGWRPGERVGLIHAAVLGEVDHWRSFYTQHAGDVSKRSFLSLMPSTPVSMCMQEHGFHGPTMSVGAMCTSGNAALIIAKQWLDSDFVDDVVVVTTDLSCSPEMLTHFRRLGVAVTDEEPFSACRPFQQGSRGFVMGEASIAFVITGQGRRPDHSYFGILGGAMTHDAHHVTSIEPELNSVRQCFELALRAGGVRADEVRYLNAHGPGTLQCDSAEATILDEIFTPDTWVYSLKPLLGHCQGASAAVEIAVAALASEHQVLPLAPQVAPGHERLLSGTHHLAPGLVAKSALGMGGHNAVVLLQPLSQN